MPRTRSAIRERKPIFALSGHPESHPVWRDPETLFGPPPVLALAAECRRVVHVLHVTTARRWSSWPPTETGVGRGDTSAPHPGSPRLL